MSIATHPQDEEEEGAIVTEVLMRVRTCGAWRFFCFGYLLLGFQYFLFSFRSPACQAP
jgi:hypothetical protein